MSKAQAEILAAEKEPATSTVTGYIDAIASDRIFGWVWDPQQPAARIAIRVELEGKHIAMGFADQAREDLAANGIGDGAHAFEIAIAKAVPPEKIGVFAVCPTTGNNVELTQRAAEGSPEAGGATEELRSAVHALYRSQRFAHGKVQSLIDTVDGLQKAMTAKARDGSVASRLETLEVAIARIDGLIRDQAMKLADQEQRPRDHISRILAAVAMLLAGASYLMLLFR